MTAHHSRRPGLSAFCAGALLFAGLVGDGWAARETDRSQAPQVFFGPRFSEIDIVRPAADWPRIYVQAKLPDGEHGVFLIDTGADISVLSPATAERLQLEVEADWGTLQGLSGSVDMSRAVIPYLALGDMLVPEIEVAVGAPGAPDSAVMMPLDGILGNNVWGRFVVEVDYPANLLVLHAPGTVRMPRNSTNMLYNGQHIFTEIELTSGGSSPRTERVVVQVDTGAFGLKLCAATGLPFQEDYTEGIEPLHGIGAAETLPPYRFLVMTRRIPIDWLRIGGRQVDRNLDAQWVSFEDTRTSRCEPTGMPGLLGHQILGGHRVIFDYQRGLLSVGKSRRKPRAINGHAVIHDQDVERYGDDPSRYLFRSKLLFGQERFDDSAELLEAYLRSSDGEPTEAAEAAVLLASLYRYTGDLTSAWRALEPLSAGDLVDQHEVVGAVNGLLFEDRVDEALAVAEAAVEERPEAAWARVARADVLLHLDRPEEAKRELGEATRLEQYPDAHLLRRARVALATGDRYGSMAHVRRLLQLYPSVGHSLWFYALLIENEQDAETFAQDMNAAMTRLHPQRRPVDFMVAAHRVLGNSREAHALMAGGIESSCEPLGDTPSKDNCLAWFYALAGTHHEEALRRIDRALANAGDRSDFLDTKAMVHLAREEYEAAHEAAIAAARLSPQDPYMLWQAERIGDLMASNRAE